ncbi:AAA family ATPase [Halomonas denitrificans]|nr:AAA family ATPase [Halomonas denitrificans]
MGTKYTEVYNGSYARSILAHIQETYGVSELKEHEESNDTNYAEQNYVLIIDEINRGNISKIFGELITLIEPSKRAGQPEALTVKLPYSQEPFSVPGNLHIIGTMNTADRSLALMDTALRRRFDFTEMMPDYDCLKGINVNGIDLTEMLRLLNQRIEYLYDREHVLGHAFFIPVVEAKEQERITVLAEVMQKKVLPLLEEYFFEDWEKIRLVLGDASKEDVTLQFIEAVSVNLEQLFGGAMEDLSQTQVRYQINRSAFEKPRAYPGFRATKTSPEAKHQEPPEASA